MRRALPAAGLLGAGIAIYGATQALRRGRRQEWRRAS